jgi:hypothetical protein
MAVDSAISTDVGGAGVMKFNAKCINNQSGTWKMWPANLAQYDDDMLAAEVERVRNGVRRTPREVDWRFRWRAVHAETCRRGWDVEWKV